MAARKYFYNPQTCTYEPVRRRPMDVAAGIMGFIALSALLAAGIMVVYNLNWDTEREASLRKENNELQSHLVSLKSEINESNQMLDFLEERDLNIYSNIYDGSPEQNDIINAGLPEQVIENLFLKGFKDPSSVEVFEDEINDILQNSSIKNQPLKGIAESAINDIDKINFFPTILPFENPEKSFLASGFGMRMNPFHHGVMVHDGIDFSAPRHTKVVATAQGTVLEIKRTDAQTGYGNRIDIDHGNGIITRYAHLQDIEVSKGDKISKGQFIGTVGNSGGTIAPSLHYEIIRNGTKVDPINFFIQNISESDFLKLYELAQRKNQSLD